MKINIRRALLASLSLSPLISASPLLAADGIELIGYGARQKAVAGADVADSVDAMSMSINPAGIVGMDRQYQFGITALLPDRGYSASGPLEVLAPGNVQSGRPIFPVPNSANVSPSTRNRPGARSPTAMAASTPLTAWAISSRPSTRPPSLSPACRPRLLAPSAGGPFGGGFAGIDYQQEFFSVVYARKFGPVTIGFAPTLVASLSMSRV